MLFLPILCPGTAPAVAGPVPVRWTSAPGHASASGAAAQPLIVAVAPTARSCTSVGASSDATLPTSQPGPLHTITAVRRSQVPRDSAAASVAMVMRCTSTQIMLHLCSSRQGMEQCCARRHARHPPLPTTSPVPLGRMRPVGLCTRGGGGGAQLDVPSGRGRQWQVRCGPSSAAVCFQTPPPRAKRACVRLYDAARHGRAGTEDT